MEQLQPHPLAECFPAMSIEEKDDFLADIKANGVREPITTMNGMILDGIHRYRASTVAGVECPSVEYIGDDPAGFVISQNARRRHLSAVERAKAVERCRNWVNGTRSPQPVPKRDIAAEAGVSTASVDRARQELRQERGEAPADPPARRRSREPGSRSHAAANGDDSPAPVSAEQELEIKLAAREATIETLTGDLEAEKERVALLSQDQNPESAKREEILNQQREEIRVLKGRNGELTAKLTEARQEARSWRRKYDSLNVEFQELKTQGS